MNKNIINFFAIFILILFSIKNSIATDNNSINFEKANKAYAEGRYNEALEGYQQIEKHNFVAAELYYNIGNAFFKLNNIPSAILYYERAKKINPADENINYNLRVANLKIIDKIEVLPELFYVRWWNSLCSKFSLTQWAWINIIVFSVFFICLAGYLFGKSILFRKISFYAAAVFLFIFLFSFVIARNTYTKAKDKNEAIIFSLSITAKSSPDNNSTDLFVIHEGLKVEILDNIGDWCEVKLANGSRGWIKKEGLEII